MTAAGYCIHCNRTVDKDSGKLVKHHRYRELNRSNLVLEQCPGSGRGPYKHPGSEE